MALYFRGRRLFVVWFCNIFHLLPTYIFIKYLYFSQSAKSCFCFYKIILESVLKIIVFFETQQGWLFYLSKGHSSQKVKSIHSSFKIFKRGFLKVCFKNLCLIFSFFVYYIILFGFIPLPTDKKNDKMIKGKCNKYLISCWCSFRLFLIFDS